MDQLQRAGARLFIGHSIASFERLRVSAQPDAVVISSAIPKDNVEILHAKSVGIPMLVLHSAFSFSLYFSRPSVPCYLLFMEMQTSPAIYPSVPTGIRIVNFSCYQ